MRLNEEKLDGQILAIFDKMRIESDDVREWFARQLRSQTVNDQKVSREQRAELNRQLSLVVQQQDQLVNMRLNEEINPNTYAAKATELRDREAKLKPQLDACDLGRHENADIAVKAFELSQSLREKWLTAEYAAKRRILEIICLNCLLGDVTLVVEKRKPFDELAKRPFVTSSREDCRSFEPWTTVRDTYATSFFSPRPWYLSELAAIADEVA